MSTLCSCQTMCEMGKWDNVGNRSPGISAMPKCHEDVREPPGHCTEGVRVFKGS